ncbi:hypothetical protein HPB47_020757 [Ixodes persulcatus]|uniref:Uncharacterized protein n=1 Tax=Ixodes persulcatus TaxID=34615 RepID=A0AC60QEE4_IXOPE|nr:hypothetical protein HPB47_020757 [Ixodes persulcatus]
MAQFSTLEDLTPLEVEILRRTAKLGMISLDATPTCDVDDSSASEEEESCSGSEDDETQAFSGVLRFAVWASHNQTNVWHRSVTSGYSLREKRRATFANWPRHAFPNVEALADAGLFYGGDDDMAICYYCGGALRSWQEDDIPFVEHARWYPECTFVKLSMEPALYNTVRSLQEECLMETDSVTTNTDEVKDKLISEIFDESTLEFYRKVGIGQSKFRQAVTHLLDQGLTINDIKEKRQIEEALKVVTTIKKEEIQVDEKPTQKQVDNSCAVCLGDQKSVLFMPCQHLVTCVDCATKVDQCPMCREQISARIRAFLC